MLRAIAVACLLSAATMSAAQTRPTPSANQLAWHKMEYYGFVHFGPNTFSGKEWGEGNEDPKSFNPTQLDCRQWARTFKQAGMKGVILTAKHHDGFCLWPSKYSTHTVDQSPIKRDVLKELSQACKAEGLKLGVYLSPWDRNHPTYGTDKYNDTFVGMLEEVLGNYGEVFEVWFDGANGEGANGKKQVYDWKRYIDTVRRLQPKALIFSDAGPDVRWVGNEAGKSPSTNWATINRSRYVPGTSLYKELGEGDPFGTDWVPSECDVSIRPGWFWRESENAKVKTATELENLYYQSVGNGSSFLLNVPPDTRGLIHENDVKALLGLKAKLDKTFKTPLTAPIKVEDPKSLSVTFKKPTLIDRIELAEDIAKGQTVAQFDVKGLVDGKWESLATGTTVGNKRLFRVVPTTVTALKLTVDKAYGGPVISTFRAYNSGEQSFMTESKAQKDARMSWWRDARFGMFIHWGLYSIPAGTWNGKEYGGASEWLINTAKVKIKDWEPLQKQFNPVNFDAKKIVGAAKAAGMKYIVITSKHHEGFAMWPTKQGTWDIGHTAFKRDPLKELSDECKKQGIKFCTYHSILDWHHPDHTPREKYDERPEVKADFERYVKFMKAQLKEVVTRYNPAVMWFDGEWLNTWNHERGVDLYNYVRGLKPDIIINNRVDTGRAGMSGLSAAGFAGDFGTPEQEIPANGLSIDWESCMTMNGSWGYHAGDNNWKSTDTLIFNLVDCASKGGNYLLNVGPNSLGEIPAASVERLEAVGKWLNQNGEAVYGSKASPFPKPLSWGRVTRKGNTLYCTVFDPKIASIELTGLQTQIRSARVLATGKQMPIIDGLASPVIDLPDGRTQPIVIKVELDGEPTVVKVLPQQNANGSFAFLAADASITGTTAKFENEKKAIGFWTNQTDSVYWDINVVRPGKYKLQLEYACEAGSEGSLCSLLSGDIETQFTIASTGGWSTFKTLDLGEVTLSKTGKTRFEVKVRMMPKGAVMNLRSIKLMTP
jgi:alpha-L-fucosidase